MKQMIFESDITPATSTEVEAEVNRRIPTGLRFVRGSVFLEAADLPFDDEVPRFTGADIDWSGLDQELGDESPFRAAIAELVYCVELINQ